jgi:hypothetical protein
MHNLSAIEEGPAGVAHEPRPVLGVPERIGRAAHQSFVKFYGTNADLVPRTWTTLSAVQRAGNHAVCAFPKGRRPRQVQDGALMFMGRVIAEDVMIYGRAIAKRHEEGADDATEEDFRIREWRRKFPHYIRVHSPEFMGGTLAMGVSLNELMDALSYEAFEVTLRNYEAGRGNIDPRKSIGPQPAVQLSSHGSAWVNERLEDRFRQFGKLSKADLADVW